KQGWPNPMPCPRCTGCTRLVDVITEEETITVSSCLNCGHVGGDALIEHHHSLAAPPEPFRELSQPIYEPTHQRLAYCQPQEEHHSVTS
ncbi:MAG: hypothetical protein ABIU05_00690, partial [Nitrospirales bacterium]